MKEPEGGRASPKVFSPSACERLCHIHELSRSVNRGGAHQEVLLNFISNHAQEIKQLLRAGNDHAYIEAGDLIVLCLELILEGGQDMEQIMTRCLLRFEKKLHGLAQAHDKKMF